MIEFGHFLAWVMYFYNKRSKKKLVSVQKKTILPITPQTHVRATQGDRWLFRIQRDKLRPASYKRLLRLERYNDYKATLKSVARSKHFTLPEQGAHIIFYIPIPKSWKEYKKKEMHMKLHCQKPDVDNILKSFFRSEERRVGKECRSRWWPYN